MNAFKTPNERAENATSKQMPENDERLLRAVREFIGMRLSEKDGTQFFDSFVKSGSLSLSDIQNDFAKFLKSRETYKTLFLHFGNDFVKKLSAETYFGSEILRQGAYFETKRKNLRKILSGEFEISPAQKEFEDAFGKLSKNDLDKLLSSTKERNDWVHRAFREPLERHDFLAFLDTTGVPAGRLTDDQREALREFYENPPPKAREIERLIPLFSKLEDRKNLIQAFLPNISLEKLVELNVIDRPKAFSMLSNWIREGKIFPTVEEAARKSIADQIDSREFEVDLSEIVIPSDGLDDATVGKIFTSNHFAKAVASEISAMYDDIKEEIFPGLPPIKADKDGKFADGFISMLETEFSGENGISGISDFRNAAHLHGNAPLYIVANGTGTDGKETTFRIRVDHWKEFDGPDGRRLIDVAFLPPGDRLRLTEATLSTITYSEFFAGLKKLRNGTVFPKGEMEKFAKSEELSAPSSTEEFDALKTELNASVTDLKSLNEALDRIDPNGRNYPIKVGASFTIGDVANESFNAYSVEKIDETSKKITVFDGAEHRAEFDFALFALTMKTHEGNRTSDFSSPEGIVSHMSETSPDYGKITFNREKKRFETKDQVGEKEYPGTKYFVSAKEKKVVEIIEARGDGATIRVHSEYDEEKHESKKATKELHVGYAYVAFLLKKYGCEPDLNFPAKPVETINANAPNQSTKHGWFKHYMGNMSFHDILHGGKNFVDFIKKRLEHGSHLHSARAMLAIGKKLGMEKWNPDWYSDLTSEVENQEKKLLEDRVEELGKMATPTRQESIKASLLNDGSHDYEHWASVLTMLEKHGTLYSGRMKELEGTWIYYKRLRKLPLDFNLERDPEFLKAKAELIRNNEPIREEGIIRTYLQKGEEGKINKQIWRMVKNKWDTGISTETENGGKEGKLFMTLERRASYTMDKLKEKEYYHAIGAMKEAWNKNGSFELKHEASFVLAISTVPERLNQQVLQTFTPMYEDGRTHSPALLFISGRQKTFRGAVEALSKINAERPRRETDTSMLTDWGNVKKTLGAVEEHDAILNFWKKHGKTLQPQLTLSPEDPVAFLSDDESLRAYTSRVNSELNEDSRFTEIEYDMGTYTKFETSPVLAGTEKFIVKFDFQATAGSIGKSPADKYFNAFVRAVDAIKSFHSDTGTDESTRQKEQKALYRHYHKTVLSHIMRTFGGSGYEKIGKSSFMHDLKRRGINIPPTNDLELLEGSTYEEHLDRDFEQFLQSAQNTADLQDHTTAEITKALFRVDESSPVRPAGQATANEGRARKAA